MALYLYYDQSSTVGRNFVDSPLNVSTILAMIYAGASPATQTKVVESLHFNMPEEQLHSAFNELHQRLNTQPEGTEENTFTRRITNSMWGEETHPFQDEYLNVIQTSYASEMTETAFAENPQTTRSQINKWVDEATEGRIKEIFPYRVNLHFAKLVLANAIYLNAPWLNEFDKSETSNRPFHPTPETVVQAPTMRQQEIMGYTNGLGYQAVELPYRGRTANMTILVPDSGRFDKIKSEFTRGTLLNNVTETMQQKTVNLLLPKFEARHPLSSPSAPTASALPAIYMSNGSINREMDFSRIDGISCNTKEPKCLDLVEVEGKVFIKVDEKGTGSAGDTANPTSGTDPQAPDVTLHVDRPFIFLIKDNSTGAILFIGRVTNPNG